MVLEDASASNRDTTTTSGTDASERQPFFLETRYKDLFPPRQHRQNRHRAPRSYSNSPVRVNEDTSEDDETNRQAQREMALACLDGKTPHEADPSGPMDMAVLLEIGQRIALAAEKNERDRAANDSGDWAGFRQAVQPIPEAQRPVGNEDLRTIVADELSNNPDYTVGPPTHRAHRARAKALVGNERFHPQYLMANQMEEHADNDCKEVPQENRPMHITKALAMGEDEARGVFAPAIAPLDKSHAYYPRTQVYMKESAPKDEMSPNTRHHYEEIVYSVAALRTPSRLPPPVPPKQPRRQNTYPTPSAQRFDYSADLEDDEETATKWYADKEPSKRLGQSHKSAPQPLITPVTVLREERLCKDHVSTSKRELFKKFLRRKRKSSEEKAPLKISEPFDPSWSISVASDRRNAYPLPRKSPQVAQAPHISTISEDEEYEADNEAAHLRHWI